MVLFDVSSFGFGVVFIIWVLEYWVKFLIGMRFKVEIDYKLLILLFFIKLIDELLVYI